MPRTTHAAWGPGPPGRIVTGRQDVTETLAQLTRAERMLAEIATAEDAQDVRDYAAAAADLAKRAKLGTPVVNHAVTIRLLAERRLAEIVDEGMTAGKITGHGGHLSKTRTPGGTPGLDDPGVASRRLAQA